MHSMRADPELGGWILDMYVVLIGE